MISTIIAIVKAVPAIKSFFDQLVSVYVAQEIAKMAAENKAAITQAVVTQDQRGVEALLGSSRAGELSGTPGTVVRDSLPGVK